MKPSLTAEQSTDCLKYHLFQDDFGAPGDRVFRDAIGVARKPGWCIECCAPISPGEQQRRHVGLYDGQMRTYRVCFACCAAMAASWKDGAESLQQRWSMRDQHRASA